MKIHFSTLCFVLLLVSSNAAFAKKQTVLSVAAPPPVVKDISQGDYVDAAGQSFPWQITSSHLLNWNNSPYLPVGGQFTPKYWVEGQTDSNWASDTSTLTQLKQDGITDICLNAGDLGLTNVPAAAAQRLINFLDTNGINYGVRIADPSLGTLTGYTREPSVYRNAAPPPSGIVKFNNIQGLKSAAFMLVTDKDGSLIQTGGATINKDGTATVSVQNGGPGDVLLLYPQRQFALGTPESHLPNLWQNYSDYRDKLILYLKQIKFGKGFRFFLDPLNKDIALNGEVQNLVPTGEGFQLGFEAWLDQKYVHNMDNLDRLWGVQNHDLPDFETASRCIPLWYQTRGIAALYDPQTQTKFDIFNNPSINNTYWDDLQSYKIESTRSYMNEIADALKSTVADVPVLYTWTQHSPIFTNLTKSGYDGLGLEAYGHAYDLSEKTGAYAYAQAEESPKTTWLIASSTASASPSEKKSAGYVSKAALFDDLGAMQQIGVRGFFLNSFQRLPLSDNKNVNLASMPDQIGWLTSYAATLQASAQDLATEKPNVLWYPENLPALGLAVHVLDGNVWWLPTFQAGSELPLGPSLRGYVLKGPDSSVSENVIWSPNDEVSSAQFDLEKKYKLTASTPDGIPINIPQKKGSWIIPVGADPIIIQGVDKLPMISNASDLELAKATRLLAYASVQHVNVDQLEEALFHADNTSTDEAQNNEIRYIQFKQIVDDLTATLQPFKWIEAESSADDTFTSVVPNPDASAGAVLSLNTDNTPPPLKIGSAGGYYASYPFYVNAADTYTIWLAGTTPGSPDASPMKWQLDGGPYSPVVGTSSSNATYGGDMSWTNIGSLPLTTGRHTLTLVVSGRRSLDNHYATDLDAVCITRVPFQPNGAMKPSTDSWLPNLSPPSKKKK